MRPNKGFSLVELMIVVLILGVLATIAIPRMMGGATIARTNACKTNIDNFNSQIELYYSTNGTYPVDWEVISKDENYFPDGEPRCPVTGSKYKKDLVNNRMDMSEHSH
jgi:prepilin-type N-terminal cleavage/methylation domain-containing protein